MDIRTEERYDDDFNQCNLFIMKRSGERVPFNESKIVRAIEKANAEVTIPLEKMSTEKIAEIAAQIRRDAENAGRLSDDCRLLHAGKVIYHLQI